MKINAKVIFPFLISSVILAGCNGGKFAEEAKKVNEKYKDVAKVEKSNVANDEKKQKEFYEKLKKPLEEVVLENDFDTVKLMDSVDVIERDHYEAGSEFAKLVGRELYNFYTLKVTPEEHYAFLSKYGSENALKDIPTKENAIQVLGMLQDMYRKQNITGDSYVLTEVIYDRFKKEGHFYRKVNSTNGEEYFISTIIKEKDGWKYEEDSPSPPFIEEGPEQEQTGESTSN